MTVRRMAFVADRGVLGIRIWDVRCGTCRHCHLDIRFGKG